jgi:NAD-dependent DNA ligase
MISPEQLRDGIFVMNTIRFGKVAEIMINCLYNLDKRLNQHHDFYDAKNQQRLEVKFSRAQQELPGITADNLLESIEKSREVSLARFIVSLSIPQVGEETAIDLSKYFGSGRFAGSI